MKNTPYDGYKGIRLPKNLQLQRIRRVIDEELTNYQRQVFLGYYYHNKSIIQLAKECGVHKSSAYRCLKRAEDKLRRYLKY